MVNVRIKENLHRRKYLQTENVVAVVLIGGKILRLSHSRGSISIMNVQYRIAGMIGRVNVWRSAEPKLVGEKKFGKWIDSAIRVMHYKIIKFGLFYLANHKRFAKLFHCKTFPLHGNTIFKAKERARVNPLKQ